ncbi:hypothetical protein WOC76_10965 [Methylocystis sp. IM3]|uniref:hypothetical protein n=1 Tax=Methylocystis sp. IM3 TaxID=3136722 RepID=UPI003119821E
MNSMNSMDEQRPESLPRRQTDPAWLQDHFLETGHDETTRSATFTFIKRRNRHYAVTCRHVMEAISDPKMVPGARFPTIAIHIDRAVLNLSYFTAKGLSLGVGAPHAETKREEIDVAIAPIDGSYWGLLTSKKNKMAIDLDNWREPKWDAVKYCLAAGYPDEKKTKVTTGGAEKVSSQLFVVVAEVSSRLARSERQITLSSLLDKAHGYYFSGMSGGPVYAVEGHAERQVEDEELFPVGIIFEGHPSSGRADMEGSKDGASVFLTERDLFFRALTLTPELFDEWLQKAGVPA